MTMMILWYDMTILRSSQLSLLPHRREKFAALHVLCAFCLCNRKTVHNKRHSKPTVSWVFGPICQGVCTCVVWDGVSAVCCCSPTCVCLAIDVCMCVSSAKVRWCSSSVFCHCSWARMNLSNDCQTFTIFSPHTTFQLKLHLLCGGLSMPVQYPWVAFPYLTRWKIRDKDEAHFVHP